MIVPVQQVAVAGTLAVLVLAALPAPLHGESRPPRTVLAVTWGAEDFPATPTVNDGIREGLRSTPEAPIEFFDEYLESDRFPPAVAAQALRAYIRDKYRGRPVDVVIAVADPALRFVHEHRDELFPGAPIVYSGLAVPEEVLRAPGPGVTGVLRSEAQVATLQMALALYPDTREVLVVANSTDAAVARTLRQRLQAFAGRVLLTYVQAGTTSELARAIRRAPRRSVVLYVWHASGDGGQAANARIASLLAAVSPVPVFGTNEAHIGRGPLGGVVRDTRGTGVRLGAMARALISGQPAGGIPIEDAPLVPLFDWRQMRRWGVSASRLPPDAVIRFQPPPAWELYRSEIIVIVTTLAGQAVLIAALLVQRKRRRRAEETVRRRETALRMSYVRIRRLAGRLIDAQEQARAEIARELHDDVGQRLVGCFMDVGTLRRASGSIQDVRSQMTFARFEEQASTVLRGIRRLAHDLHPASLRLLGLAPALEAHCAEIEQRHGVSVLVTPALDGAALRPDVALCLFRIAQEALRNAVVHGRAQSVRVLVTWTPQHVELLVDDDGCGFDIDRARRGSRGLGLVSMEERAHAAGGELHVETRPGVGATIRVRIPAVAAVLAAPAPGGSAPEPAGDQGLAVVS